MGRHGSAGAGAGLQKSSTERLEYYAFGCAPAAQGQKRVPGSVSVIVFLGLRALLGPDFCLNVLLLVLDLLAADL